MSIERRKTREIRVGNVRIGGDNPIVVQSMTNTDTRDVEATVEQIRQLADAGCEIVRVAVLNEGAAWAIGQIKQQISIPLIADIHFDHRLAVMALEAGADALRINPGNIGGRKNVDAVVDAARAHGASIRVGVNSGSIEKALLEKFGGPTPEAMVESALAHVRMLEERDFYETKISLKSSSVLHTIDAYRLLAGRCDYPLHIGVTEAGTLMRGAIKSSVGLGILLWQGIGDTLRISLTEDPVKEMAVAWELLRALGLRYRGPEIISCPTCGRTEIGLINLAEEVERRLEGVTDSFKVAVMGCVVNGPGEAREADIGVAGGRDKGIIFRKGEIVRTVKGGAQLLEAFMEELDSFLAERKKG
ncbi:flavodoxin-dependent (E)-4-hydroxy-3-methylbut-2-enyl-diphosphate synthase [Desulfovibrio mangrovi]|uniref:flavodoxin-dependent (E)-4-hydroxy-3-methylbut-2-enyl-diphosphate synthase n=1 Tax=Desulfovibrio mangrovi TaxID=2976983 RepID=UPI0022486CE4|nr:flavodoxin-dependent (E)-4-hydroxy-3-methylbut-2-enyl-diphosphate synthase [Desulfovibrio mangrovi]UZP68647.1 flavodoxin-dependent (E)-4-hydroxy-3-methylbut-2-enyl-diphosphate synthase [Desulfovibrio mangrovi]